MCRRFWWLFLVMLPIGALMGLALAAVFTFLIPKQYESQAVIELKSIHEHEKWTRDPREGEDKAPAWVLDEIGRMKSRESLDEVISRLELEKNWNLKREDAREILNQSLQIHSIRETDLISIRMRHANKIDARDIALEVANVCKARREKIAANHAEHQRQELNRAISAQEERIENLKQTLNKLDKDTDRTGEASANATSELQTEQKMLETLKRHQTGARILAKIPDDAVLIHDTPRIADVPVSPNVTLNLVLGTVFGLFLSPLLALLLIRFNRENFSQRAS